MAEPTPKNLRTILLLQSPARFFRGQMLIAQDGSRRQGLP